LNNLLFSEINEQPLVLERFFKEKKTIISEITRKISRKFKYILIAARGTSDNAARYAQYVMGANNNIQVGLATPSLFTIYGSPPELDEALVLGISQSGQSPDIVSVIDRANKQGRPTISITNDAASPLAQASEFIIDLHAGVEKAVAATKTYTTSLMALAMISATLSGDEEKMTAIGKIPGISQKTLENTIENIKQVQRYRYMEHCVVLGRGFNYATAFETSLKIKELTRVIAVPYSSADFKHGPIATVQKGFPIFIIAPSGKMFDHIHEFSSGLLDIGAELIVVSNKAEILNKAATRFPIPDNLPEWLSPIVTVIPGQLFARQLAIEKGLDSDNPEGLTKVTETY